MMKTWALSILSILGTLTAFGQQKFIVKKDLKDNWLTYDGQDYVSFEGNVAGNTIYLNLNADDFHGDKFHVASDYTFFMFVNGKVIGEYKQEAFLNLDSLAGVIYTNDFLVAIHQPSLNTGALKTEIVSVQKTVAANTGEYQSLKPGTSFKDFVIIAGLLLIIMFLIMFKANPKLASDYFSVTSIFTLREADDSQSNARLTSSSNIQFYIFCSLLLAYYLVIVSKHLPEIYTLRPIDAYDSFGGILWQWLKLSLLIFCLFLFKILLVFTLTRLFNMKGTARIHFFNWVRTILIVLSVSSVILFIYYILRGQSDSIYLTFLWVIVVTLSILVIMGFFKLGNKSEHSMFHLFSYICATEIIPLLIIIKVLLQ